MPDYSKCVIYKICCKDTSIEDFYIGSTCNFTRRKYQHKSICHNPNATNYNLKIYQFIRDQGGFQNWDMVMIHQEAVENKLQKERLERYIIEDLKPSLNIKIPTRTTKERYQDNKERMNQQQRQYREANREHVEQYQTQWRIDNKERIKEQQRQNYDCECGAKFTHGHKARHLRSKKHIEYIEKTAEKTKNEI
ncbi:MAG: GIY-YIG nuclease family protein [Cyanophyceae cyanobacterium]